MQETPQAPEPKFSPQPPAAKPQSFAANPRLLMGFGVLVLLLAVVIFVLPAWVQKTGPIMPISDATKQTADTNSKSGPLAGPTLESPWTDAQIAKERRETQDILAKLLNAQEQLEKQDVEQWAADAYNAALKTAESGDNHYRARQFTEAKERYNNTLTQFKHIAEQAQTVLEQQLKIGAQALSDTEAEPAIQAYTLALKIDAKREEAQLGLERALALTDVLQLIKQGESLENSGNFDEAKARYTNALEQDPESPLAQTHIETIKRKIVERDFTEAMSAGYAALAQQNFTAARTKFKRALAIKPEAVDAQQALTQAENQQQQSKINKLLSEAAKLESQEQWSQAVDTYRAIMSLDSNVVKAKVGAIRSETRLNLANNIQQIITDPTRLQNDPSYQYAQTLLRDLRSIPQLGPAAQAQSRQLEKLLELSRVPVHVSIKSDAQTRVTLYRVGELGLFNEHDIELTPGKYTLVGTREGYRDVRKEFTIEPRENPTQPVIVIQCEEPIAKG